MTNDEYHFLTDRDWKPEEDDAFFKAGEGCYKKGWVDVFGLVTPKGHEAIKEFENVG